MENTNLSPFSSFESIDAFDDEDDLDASFYSKTSRRDGISFFSDVGDDEARHFLDCCSLCCKRLAGGRDIYMYKGDTPFCSEDCRQEQIEIDAAEEKRHHKPMMIKSNEKISKSKSSAGSLKSQKMQSRAAGAVVVG